LRRAGQYPELMYYELCRFVSLVSLFSLVAMWLLMNTKYMDWDIYTSCETRVSVTRRLTQRDTSHVSRHVSRRVTRHATRHTWHENYANTKIWHCFDLVLAFFCHCSDLVLTLFWPCSDIVLTLFWPCSDLVLTLFLHCSDLVLTLFWHCSDLVLTLFWPCSYIVLTLFWPCSYIVLTLFWHCFDLVLALFLISIKIKITEMVAISKRFELGSCGWAHFLRLFELRDVLWCHVISRDVTWRHVTSRDDLICMRIKSTEKHKSRPAGGQPPGSR